MIGTVTFFVLIVFLLTMLAASAAPWLPTRQKDLDRVLALAAIKPGEVFYDLGCGDGRLIVTAAEAGAKATGFDLSLMSYLMAIIRLSAVRSNARVVFKNLFRQNLSGADIVYLFLTPGAMPKIKTKLETEMKKGGRVISYAFAIHGLVPIATDARPGRQTLYLYEF